MDEETQRTKETEGTRWRVGVLSAAKYRDALISEPVDDAALANTLRTLSSQLPPGFKAFAFASRGDRQFDDGVAAAAVDSLAALAAFSNEPRFLDEPLYWYGCDIRRRVRFDEECDAQNLAQEVRKNEELERTIGDVRAKARIAYFASAISAFFAVLANAFACLTTARRGTGSIREQPALEQQDDQNEG